MKNLSRSTPRKDMLLVLGIPLLLMGLLLAFEPSALDLWVADHLYLQEAGLFIGRKSYFLEVILHYWIKRIMYTVPVAVLVILVLSYCRIPTISLFLKPHRRRITYVLLSLVITIGIVTPLKTATAVQCPWNLERYGGTEHYSPLTSPRPPEVARSGMCWPGGHASVAFCLFAFFFALRDIASEKARKVLVFTIIFGVILSVGRMLQGAHFLSHNVWTMLIDWTICATLYFIMLAPHTAKIPVLNRQNLQE